MELTLFYRGALRSNGDAAHKHALRKCFDLQLRRLYPASNFPAGPAGLHPFGSDLHTVSHPDGKILFQTLACRAFSNVADVDVTLLRPSGAGSIVRHGGDIDNRLKTLFDALRMPNANEIPSDAIDDLVHWPAPFFCVLEDDALITGVTVRSDRLLDVDPDENQRDAVVLIKISLRSPGFSPWNKPLLRL